jgi:hypothetical protein
MERFGTESKEIAEKAHGIAESVQGKMKARVERARDYARGLRQKEPREIASDVGGFVKEHPLAVLSTGYVIGVAVWTAAFGVCALALGAVLLGRREFREAKPGEP